MRAWLLLLAVLATFQSIVQVASTEDISTKFIAAITTKTNQHNQNIVVTNNNPNRQLQNYNYNYNLININQSNLSPQQFITASTINNKNLNKNPVQHKKHHHHHSHHNQHNQQKKKNHNHQHKKDIIATHFYENSLSDNLSENKHNEDTNNNINNNKDSAIIIEIKNFEEFETKPKHKSHNQHPKKVQHQQKDISNNNNNDNNNINNNNISEIKDQLENNNLVNNNKNKVSENNLNAMAVVKTSEIQDDTQSQQQKQQIEDEQLTPSTLTQTFESIEPPSTVSSKLSSKAIASSSSSSSVSKNTSIFSPSVPKVTPKSSTPTPIPTSDNTSLSKSPSDEDYKSDYHPEAHATSETTLSSSSSSLSSSSSSFVDTNSDSDNNNNLDIELLHKTDIDDDELTYSNKELLLEKVKPDPSTLVEIENSLLSLFNMKRPPTIDRSKIIIPDAMKALYAQMMGQRIDSVNIPKPGLLTKTANTVRSFTHKDSKIDDRFPHHHRFRLHFDIKTIPGEEKLKAAELQLSRDAISHAVLNPRLANRTRYQVLVYDITRVGIRGKREPSYLLLDNKTIRLNSTDTISLDVQPAVDRWLASPTKNYGLLVEVRTMRSLKPAPHHHVRLRRSADETHDNWLRKQPLLFTYTDDGRHKSRSIRDVSNRSKRAGHNRRNHRRKNTEETCHRKALYVDFSDVGWANWIVAPPGYDAFYCHGKCPFPLAEHFNSTNHAVVQTLVNNINPEKVPKPCCVPTQLEGISMLYLNDQNSVVLKNYQDMTVVGCGCR